MNTTLQPSIRFQEDTKMKALTVQIGQQYRLRHWKVGLTPLMHSRPKSDTPPRLFSSLRLLANRRLLRQIMSVNPPCNCMDSTARTFWQGESRLCRRYAVFAVGYSLTSLVAGDGGCFLSIGHVTTLSAGHLIERIGIQIRTWAYPRQ